MTKEEAKRECRKEALASGQKVKEQNAEKNE